MKKKHKLQKFLSTFTAHLDNQSSEAQPNNEEIENSVEKFLKLLNADENGPNSLENSSDRSELASLVETLHKGYKTVRGNYSTLTGSLRKKIRAKSSDNGSFSFDISSSSSESSNSESEDFSHKKNKSDKFKEIQTEQISLEEYQTLQEQLGSLNIRNKEFEIEMQAKLEEVQSLTDELAEREVVITTLKNELQVMKENFKISQNERDVLKIGAENSSMQQDELIQRISSMHEENEALRSESATAFSRIHEADKSIEECKTELDQIKEEMWKVKSENNALKEKLDDASQEVTGLKQQLSGTSVEKEALQSGNFVLLRRIEEAEKALADLRDQADKKLEMATTELISQNAKLSSENENLKLRLEAADLHGAEVIKRLSAAEQENSSLKSEVQKSRSRIQEIEKTITDLTADSEFLRDENSKCQEINNDLKQKLKAKDVEIEALTSEHLDAVEVARLADEKNFMLLEEIEKMKEEDSQFLVDYKNMKLNLEAANQEVSKMKQILEATEDEKHSLTSENSALLIEIQKTERVIDDLRAETQQLGINESQLQIKISDLDQELQAVNLQLIDANKALAVEEEEKNALTLEKSKIMNQLQQVEIIAKELEKELESLRQENFLLQENKIRVQEAEKIIEDLKTEMELLRADNSHLKAEVSNQGVELEASNLQLTDLNKILGIAEEEKKTLTSENSIIMSKLQQAQIKEQELENDLAHLRDENSMLQQNQVMIREAEKIIDDVKAEAQLLRDNNSQLQIKSNELNLDLESVNLQLTDLKEVTGSLEEENSSLVLEISSLRAELQQAEENVKKLDSELGQLQEETSMLENNKKELQLQKFDLEGRLGEKKSEILSLQVELEEAQKEASDQMAAITVQVNNLQMEKDLLNTHNKELEEQIKLLTCRSSEDQMMIKSLQDEVESISSSLKNQEEEFLADYKKLEDRLREIADKKTEELGIKEETVQTLEAVNKEKEKEIGKLAESRKEVLEKLEMIEAKKEDADKEIAKLRKQVQTLEVQLCLSNQKLKITETENKEKEEGYKMKMEALQKERRVAEEQMQNLYAKIDILENVLRQLKQVAKDNIAALEDGYNELELVFEESMVHIQKQLSTCTEEIKLLKNLLAKLISEKHELSLRLKYKEGIISMMKDEAQSNSDKFSNATKELAIVRTRAVESEKKIKVLQEMLGKKDKEVSDKDEAKREAIRQLCLLIEYHRENCIHLSDYLTTVLKRTGRSS